jgi:flagellin-like protein
VYQKGGIKKKMKKLLRSKKALSPVIASIILIAVTVAVSIAVAAWMGALTFTFMKVEKLEVTGYTWAGGSPATNMTLTVRNTGTSTSTFNKVTVNGVQCNSTRWWANDLTLDAGEEATLKIKHPTLATFSSGGSYEFDVITSTNYVLPYTKQAP